MGRIRDRLVHAWNAFIYEEDRSQTTGSFRDGPSYGAPMHRPRLRSSNERSIIASVMNRVGIDVAAVDIVHAKVDSEGRLADIVDDGLHQCLTVEANIDQAARAFRQDIVMTLLDKGVCAVVAVDTTISPLMTGGFDVKSMRVGEVVQWYPTKVRVRLYDERDGQHKEITLEKRLVAVIENPLYTVMNEPNSTLQRLIRKLNLLDAVDEASSSGKMDLIIQLPYVIKSEARREQAEQRRKDIEFQLKGSQYGIAYTDGTEKITQLNRPAENNLLAQVEYLTKMLYGQLGLTEEVMNGTADEKAMLNYRARTVEPLVTAIVEELHRVFLTKTARTQGHAIKFFFNAFSLVPIADLADIVDKLSRNEVATSNEFRSVLGLKPAKDKRADQLVNSNMPAPSAPPQPAPQDQPTQQG